VSDTRRYKSWRASHRRGWKNAEGAGLDPEGNPDDRALSERLAAELVDVGYASAEAGSSGFLVITTEGEQALKGGASRNDSPPSLS
jgi:hypothetical protein